MAFSYSAHIGYLFSDLPLTDRIAAARRSGFAAVEHPAPYSVPAPQMARLLAQSGLRYTQFGLYSGRGEAGEKGIGIFPGRRAEFEKSITDGLDYAQAIGVKMVHAMSGVLPEDQRQQSHWDCYVENLALCARKASERGITVIVEAMSPAAVPDYFIATPDRAAQAIADAGEPNLGLLLDIFHTASSGLDIEGTIRAHAGRIAHVHIADFPGRHEPGSASLDFDAIEGVLEDAGYDGVLGCEYVPAGRTEDGLGWLKSRLAR